MNGCRFPCSSNQKLQSGHMQSAIWHFLEDCLGRSKPTSEKSSLRSLKEGWKRQFYARLSKQLLYNFDTCRFFYLKIKDKKQSSLYFLISHAAGMCSKWYANVWAQTSTSKRRILTPRSQCSPTLSASDEGIYFLHHKTITSIMPRKMIGKKKSVDQSQKPDHRCEQEKSCWNLNVQSFI